MTSVDTSTSIAVLTPTTNNLIPSSLMDELLYIRDQISWGNWRVGEIANEIYELSLANGIAVTRLQVCSRVGAVIGKSCRSVRAYAAAASFYRREDRDRYEVLPFSHFVYAMTKQDGWRDVLELSLDYMDRYGAPPSVEKLTLGLPAIKERTFVDYPQGAEETHALAAPLSVLPSPMPLPGNTSVIDDDWQTVAIGVTVRQIEACFQPLPVLLERLSRFSASELAHEVGVAIVTVRQLLERLESSSGATYNEFHQSP